MLSILTGFSHILAFPLFVFCADTGSIPLLIFVNFIGNFLPGLLVLRKVTGVIRRDAFYEVVGFRSSPNWFLGIQLAETSANSLNASLVYSRLGDVATGEYLLYSKFALLYDFIPISLIPIVVSKRNHKNSNDKLLTFIVVANGVLISLIIFGIFGPTITGLSAGNITPSLVQLCPFMFGGFVISATSLYIQGAVRDEIIPFRLKASMITTMVNILATFIFLPIVGVSATYAMTGLTTGLYALLLSRKIKQLSNGN
jgi:hypothetical protein